MKLKDYITSDKPRERLINYGVSNLSDSELLCILLRTGNKKESVNELSSKILKTTNGVKGLSELSFEELVKIEGIKNSKASILLSAFEISKRAFKEKDKLLKLTNALDIYNYYKNEFILEKQEKFYVLLFDNKLNYIKRILLFKGSINNVLVEPREIFKEAIKSSASFIVLMHNHPSGDTSPSKEDIETTNKIIKCGNLMNIKVIDHIIISSNSYYSFYDKNNINE